MFSAVTLRTGRNRSEREPQASTSMPSAKQRLMAQFDDEYVQALMRRHGGNITQAAKAANLSRKHVYALLRRIELDGEDDGDPGADPSPPGSARGPR